MSPQDFMTTRWSLVLAAKGPEEDAQRALAELCELYWQPVFVFYRALGHDEERARDLTQGLFLHLLEREDIGRADRERGRFRSYLKACARHFASNVQRDERAQKRGGDSITLTLTPKTDDDAFEAIEIADAETPERAFERAYARTLLQTALARLEAEFEERGRGREFRALRAYLEADGGPPYAAKAEELDSSEGAVRVLVHRIRRRFRELLVLEVRQTLLSPEDAHDEISVLLEALRST